jgi:hypothetical protein
MTVTINAVSKGYLKLNIRRNISVRLQIAGGQPITCFRSGSGKEYRRSLEAAHMRFLTYVDGEI